MTLMEEVQAARKKVVTDGYEMSLGELINLYRDDELKVDPVFQRLFRWDDERKTRFIESILLGIPFPPIFVSQDLNGIWESIHRPAAAVDGIPTYWRPEGTTSRRAWAARPQWKTVPAQPKWQAMD